MCFGAGGGGRIRTPAPVQLPPPPQIDVSAPMLMQSTPTRAQPIDQTAYKKRGKRALTIPQTGTTAPGA